MPALNATGASGARAASSTRNLPGWTGLPSTQASPEQIRDAFEALLVAEVLKPFEESLSSSGLFPGGAAGDIYAHFWKQHLGQLLAEQIDLLPGLVSGDGAGVAVGGAGAAARIGGSPQAASRLPITDALRASAGRAPKALYAARAGAPGAPATGSALPAGAAGVFATESALPAGAPGAFATESARSAGSTAPAIEAGGSSDAAREEGIPAQSPGTAAEASGARSGLLERPAMRPSAFVPTAAPAAATGVAADPIGFEAGSAEAAAAAKARAEHPLASRLEPFEEAIQEAAGLVSLGANWLRAVILQESGGDVRAISPKGAQGLMQILPATGRALGLRNPFDPVENIRAGARYLDGLLRQFGDIRLALAAYNAGPGRVATYGGIPPFRETQRYVERVLALKEDLDRVIPGDGGAGRP